MKIRNSKNLKTGPKIKISKNKIPKTIIPKNIQTEFHPIANIQLKYPEIRKETRREIINSTVNTSGRFGNMVFRNLIAHFICKVNNLKFEYSNLDDFTKLGIELFSGTETFRNSIEISDEEALNFDKFKGFNINLSHHYYQTKEISLYLKEYLNASPQKESIIEHNKYKERYSNNNDVYVHVRLGDVIAFNPGFRYYDSILSGLNFEQGFISSDSINHQICQKLIEKYKLKPLGDDIVDTIMFASTCKYIILSDGTLSWTIGVLGFYASNIYYPKIKNYRHGDIFVFPDWKEIS